MMNQKVAALKDSLEFFRVTYFFKRCVLREAGADAQKEFFRCNKKCICKVALVLASSFEFQLRIHLEQRTT